VPRAKKNSFTRSIRRCFSVFDARQLALDRDDAPPRLIVALAQHDFVADRVIHERATDRRLERDHLGAEMLLAFAENPERARARPAFELDPRAEPGDTGP